MEIRSIGRPTRAEWEWVWRGCAWATGFQSPDWAETWAVVTGGALRPRARRIEFSDGAVAILPLCATRVGRGLLRAKCMPEGTLGGWIARMPLGAEHVACLAERLRGGLGELRFRVSPYAPHADHPALPVAGWDETLATDLRPGYDAVLRRWSKGHRAAVRQAERAGVEVRRGRGLADWRTYHEIYRRSRARWGESAQSKHPRELFDALARLDPRDVQLWLASVGGRIAAGAVCLTAARHVAYWHGAADDRFFPKRPVHLLMHRAMRDAAESGRDWYDFNPSGGLEGVAHFKRGFGAQALAVPILRHHTRRARVAARTRRWLDRAAPRA